MESQPLEGWGLIAALKGRIRLQGFRIFGTQNCGKSAVLENLKIFSRFFPNFCTKNDFALLIKYPWVTNFLTHSIVIRRNFEIFEEKSYIFIPIGYPKGLEPPLDQLWCVWDNRNQRSFRGIPPNFCSFRYPNNSCFIALLSNSFQKCVVLGSGFFEKILKFPNKISVLFSKSKKLSFWCSN